MNRRDGRCWGLGLAAILVAVTGCREKEENPAQDERGVSPPAGPSAPANPPTSPPADPRFGLSSGETLWWRGKPDTLVWKPTSDTAIELYVVQKEPGHNQGILRARQGDQRQDVTSLRVRRGPPHVSLQSFPNGRAVFRYAMDPRARGANPTHLLLLTYDPSTKAVRVSKSWTGESDKLPPWDQSGNFTVDPKALESCQTVVAKIKACADEAPFKSELFARLEEDERGRAAADFPKQIGRWKDRKAMRAQCEDWASDRYTETHLSDPKELDELVKDTQLDCAGFGRELVDEGGLPQPIARAVDPK
jgi:hypothetical protein